MSSREFADRVARRARRAGLGAVAPELVASLEAYYRLLESWNAKINLTALDLPPMGDEAIDRLLIEPLVALRHVPADARQAIDVGSGGGSPAIPMQLARPDLAFTLVEAKIRKSAFLREAGRQLALPLRVETSRYEALLARPDLHEAFDLVTMRAVRVEPRVLIGLQAFLRPGGLFLLFRGPSGPSVPASPTPPLAWEATHPLVDALRSRLTVLRKMRLG
ncbi:MAG: 16S rRNA (guanine(527)-N(7))-methyltransferase RsmG [Acidobacteria bacterium]|nr:16S rRNA (guanine(527)-N(7))-methyltransferase RsmG [Acidobacteriota bacterium]